MALRYLKTVRSSRAFTLLELVPVIAITGILAIVIVPYALRLVEGSRIASTKDSLRSIAVAMKRFHDETGVWPLGGGTWHPASGGVVGPGVFGAMDTALFTAPGTLGTLPACNESGGPIGTRCWGGPYLSIGATLGDASGSDKWGRKFRYAYLPKGHSAAPNGIIVIWSTGPNGVNETSDPEDFARGQPTSSGADDIIQVVGAD